MTVCVVGVVTAVVDCAVGDSGGTIGVNCGVRIASVVVICIRLVVMGFVVYARVVYGICAITVVVAV